MAVAMGGRGPYHDDNDERELLADLDDVCSEIRHVRSMILGCTWVLVLLLALLLWRVW